MVLQMINAVILATALAFAILPFGVHATSIAFMAFAIDALYHIALDVLGVAVRAAGVVVIAACDALAALITKEIDHFTVARAAAIFADNLIVMCPYMFAGF